MPAKIVEQPTLSQVAIMPQPSRERQHLGYEESAGQLGHCENGISAVHE